MEKSKFVVICLNDSNIPSEIPPELRVVKNKKYVVKSILNMKRQKNIIGFVLDGLELPETCPYDSWDSRRFGVVSSENLSMEEIIESLENMEEDELEKWLEEYCLEE
jgi:hypothetical protein